VQVASPARHKVKVLVARIFGGFLQWEAVYRLEIALVSTPCTVFTSCYCITRGDDICRWSGVAAGHACKCFESRGSFACSCSGELPYPL
jgi:hypothetical protein